MIEAEGQPGPAPRAGPRTSRRPRELLLALWRPAGLAYLAMMLAGLAAGLWPAAIYRPHAPGTGAPVPALQAVAAAQAAFLLLAYPIINLRRVDKSGRPSWAQLAGESLGFLIAAVPFYVAAAFVADAVATDAVRAGVYVGSLFPLGWAASWWLSRGRVGQDGAGAGAGAGAASAVVLVLALSALGLPAAYYIAREFLNAPVDNWLWYASPLTCAWQEAQSRAGGPLPRPLWALVLWPAASAASVLMGLLRPPRRT